MEEKSDLPRQFFKVMMPGFREKLRVPAAFSRKMRQDKSEELDDEVASVTSCKGTWNISLCKESDDEGEGVIWFKKGWPDFVRAHELNVGDFVVFKPMMNSGDLLMRFKVYIFDPNGCEREFDRGEASAAHANSGPIQNQEARGSGASYHSPNPHFVLTMKPSNSNKRGTLNIPVKFLKSNDLIHKTSATLRDPHGNTWPVKIFIKRRYNNSMRGMMTKGWRQFYESNKLKDGDTCLFELQPSSRHSLSIGINVQIFFFTCVGKELFRLLDFG